MVNFAQSTRKTNRRAAVLLICDCDVLTDELLAALPEDEFHTKVHRFEAFTGVTDNAAVDLVILDTGFDARRALTLLKELKSKRPDVPVVLIADRSSEDHVIAAFRLGARDYFKKPLNIILFKDTVKNLLKLRRSSTERRLPLNSKKSPVAETFIQANTNMPPPILKSLLYMESNLAEHISLEVLAEKAGMSKHHFCRAFKKHTGFSPFQSLASMRIERAKNLLKSAHFTISTVAAESGFNDIGNFIRHFKKVTGITATDFRNSLKSKN